MLERHNIIHKEYPATLLLLKQHLTDIKDDLISQQKKGNLLNGAGVYAIVLIDKIFNLLKMPAGTKDA